MVGTLLATPSSTERHELAAYVQSPTESGVVHGGYRSAVARERWTLRFTAANNARLQSLLLQFDELGGVFGEWFYWKHPDTNTNLRATFVSEPRWVRTTHGDRALEVELETRPVVELSYPAAPGSRVTGVPPAIWTPGIGF